MNGKLKLAIIFCLSNFQQGVYSPYMNQQYLQMYGVPGTVNPGVYPYGQVGHSLSGNPAYTTVQSYGIPGHHIMQFTGSNISGASPVALPTIQTPYPTGNVFFLLLKMITHLC